MADNDDRLPWSPRRKDPRAPIDDASFLTRLEIEDLLRRMHNEILDRLEARLREIVKSEVAQFWTGDKIIAETNTKGRRRLFNIGLDVANDPDNPGSGDLKLRDLFGRLQDPRFIELLDFVDKQKQRQKDSKDREANNLARIMAFGGLLSGLVIIGTIVTVLQAFHILK